MLVASGSLAQPDLLLALCASAPVRDGWDGEVRTGVQFLTW